jgi:hypothetical protein
MPRCVTGTPIGPGGLQDMFGALRALQAAPLSVLSTFRYHVILRHSSACTVCGFLCSCVLTCDFIASASLVLWAHDAGCRCISSAACVIEM